MKTPAPLHRLLAQARVPLIHAPTPLEPLPVLSRRYGGPVLIKRDDCTGLATGGNKARKLEYVLAEALAQGANTIITFGGLQSNHARQTAAACARLNLRCVLALRDSASVRCQHRDQGGNVLLDELLGAQVHVLDAQTDPAETLPRLAQLERSRGHRPYIVPLGASTALGTFGYVRCAQEIVSQLDGLAVRARHVFVAAGSGGTQAGLTSGFAMLGQEIETVGVDIDANVARTRQRVADLTVQCLDSLDFMPMRVPEWTVLEGFAGTAYGEPTPEGIAAIAQLARTEGILLDPVYTGKAMAALIAHLETGAVQARDGVVFVHTGGLPILFAYEESLGLRPTAEPGA